MTKYLHTMIRVSSLEDSIAFFEVLGLREIRRRPDEKGRYTNVFLAAPGDEEAAVELTYNWDAEPYAGGRNFGHLAYAVDNIYDTCNAFIAHGVTINRPPRDGRMAFVRTPDGISIELLQAGRAAARRTLDQHAKYRLVVEPEEAGRDRDKDGAASSTTDSDPPRVAADPTVQDGARGQDRG